MSLQTLALSGFVQTLERQFPVLLQCDETIYTIRLNLIMVDEECRNMGYGTEVMERLISFSENIGKPIELTPSGKFGGKKRKLKKFYKGFGFEKNNSRLYDMIRYCN